MTLSKTEKRNLARKNAEEVKARKKQTRESKKFEPVNRKAAKGGKRK